MNISPTHILLDVGLPKWPALLVTGDPVTEDQAAEIIVRTNHWPMCLNDRAWVAQAHEIVGLVDDDRIDAKVPGALRAHWDEQRAWADKHGILELEYLYNSQIGSAYIGGPHGWCHWNGFLGCDSYNIGKYPRTEKVLAEWQTIARAFPFLKLRCQLFDGESGISATRALIQYNVEGGEASVVPVEKIGPVAPQRASLDAQLIGLFTNPIRERGCSADTLKRAVQIVRAARERKDGGPC